MTRLSLRTNPLWRRILVGSLVVVLFAYCSFAGFIWWAMHQSPEIFGRVMAKVSGPVVFILFPFETFWMHARAGSLHVGDSAPDFSLFKLDKSERVQLSSLNKAQPVVLVFGSYT